MEIKQLGISNLGKIHVCVAIKLNKNLVFTVTATKTQHFNAVYHVLFQNTIIMAR